MKTKFSKILIGIQALAAVCLIGALKIWAPVCTKLLTLESGAQTHMKCHYSSQAALVIAVILLVAALAAFISKGDHKKLHFVSIAGAVSLFLIFGSHIGICANAEMACHSTALWVRIMAGVIIAAGAVDLFTGGENQIPS